VQYAGIDLHGKYSVAVVLDSAGAQVAEGRIPNDPAAYRAFFEAVEGPVEAVVESTGNWHWLYDLLESEGIETKLAHPAKVKAIAQARLKNDRIDAKILAHLLRTDLLPESYVPPKEIRALRELVRYRASLVRNQTRLKARIRWLLAKRNLRLEARTLMSVAGRAELEALALDPRARRELEQCLALLDHLEGYIRELNREIRGQAKDDDRAQLLMTVPGIGYYLALLILAEIGDIDRFGSARKLASYAGLVPTTRSSGGRTYHGRITKQGSVWLRWAMIQAVLHTVRQPGPIQRFYRKQLRRKGKPIARVAAARKLLTHLYWVLVNEEPYDEMVRRLEAAEMRSGSYKA
jgi:transposase